MALEVTYVESLEAILEPAVAFLSEPLDDLFATQQVIVPTAGVQAWLTAELAKRLGATSDTRADGVVANVRFSYPGSIAALLQSRNSPASDPWTVEGMTFSLLEVLVNRSREYEWLITRAGGPLLAARQVADLFDHYHFRRPEMIRRWDIGIPTLNPEPSDSGTPRYPELSEEDRWQFDLWRRLRERIAVPCPVTREDALAGPPASVLVAGLQTLSLNQIDLLQQWGNISTDSGKSCRVQVLLVHPALPLAARWAEQSPPLTRRLAPIRSEVSAPQDVDSLVYSWLKETRENQWLLASQGISPKLPAQNDAASKLAGGATLLARLQHTVQTGGLAHSQPFDETDESLLVHRCHDLSRQAEVIHDALLHAFRDIPGLAPHEVVIVSPQIAELAPHLEAAFDRTVHSGGIATKLSLQIADRGIAEVSQGAELLVALIELVGSRCSAEAMLNVATHPLVLKNFAADEDVADAWKRYIRRTRIRWGIDAAQRSRLAPGLPELAAHTWRLGLQRMLLGAMLPDSEPAQTLGIVPLNDSEAADLKSFSSLIAIVGVIEQLSSAAESDFPVEQWCDLIERALERLAGEDCDELTPALKEIEAFRREALAGRQMPVVDGSERAQPGISVPFRDVQKLLQSRLTGTVGRQPLRTGAITATSMIPLRGVPFRVICVAGFDGDVVNPRESDGEDLTERQQFLGDPDPRLDFRRGLLDCLLAARDRLLITCRGMDVKNNATLPLATPLAELVDFAARHGVLSRKRLGEEHSLVEVFHPRHAISQANFLPGKVLRRGVWSHDPVARSTAENLGRNGGETAPVISASVQLNGQVVIPLHWLAEFACDPLHPFIRRTLEISNPHSHTEAIPATLPLELSGLERWRLRMDYLSQRLHSPNPAELRRNWTDAVVANGEVPVLQYGAREAETVTRFGESLLALAEDEGVPLPECQRRPVDLDLGEFRITGELENWHEANSRIAIVRTGVDFDQPKILAALQLLCLQAGGEASAGCLVFNQRKDWELGQVTKKGKEVEPVQARTVLLDKSCGQRQARESLLALCQLYQQAMCLPCGRFGKTVETLVENREKAREGFLQVLAQPDYQNSLEVIAFGAHPDFDEVFPEDDSELNKFFERFGELTKVVYKNPNYLYGLQ